MDSSEGICVIFVIFARWLTFKGKIFQRGASSTTTFPAIYQSSMYS